MQFRFEVAKMEMFGGRERHSEPDTLETTTADSVSKGGEMRKSECHRECGEQQAVQGPFRRAEESFRKPGVDDPLCETRDEDVDQKADGPAPPDYRPFGGWFQARQSPDGEGVTEVGRENTQSELQDGVPIEIKKLANAAGNQFEEWD